MSGGIYLIQDSGELVEMIEHAYDSEDLLQGLLAKYPNLMAGDQIDSESPRRWLLVTREATVASEEGGSDRWYVDHLFLDQDAIPTLVEVKRKSDTRIRREVVGQMLDYAANAVKYWPIETIIARFESTCEKQGIEPEQALADFIGAEGNPDEFWQRAKTNLQAGRVRMIFAADVIPPELQRVVEFLNEQMDPAQVLAFEIRQFVGKGLKTLVPRVIGQTSEAVQKKTSGTTASRQWDEASFCGLLEERGETVEAKVVRKILEWASDRKLRVAWGKGGKEGSFYLQLDHKGIPYYTVCVRTGYKRSYVQVPFQDMRSGPFADKGMRNELRRRLNEIPTVDIAEDALTKYPSFPVAALRDEKALTGLLAALDWMIQQLKVS